MQQGRVQLDADWNEQVAILVRYLRALAADLIGPHGGPAENFGFEITPVQFAPPVVNDFRIGLGDYYVDGILCEADTTPVAIVPQATTSPFVIVDHWTLDGEPFQANRFVEVFDDAQGATFKPAVVQVTNPDHAQLRLKLQSVNLSGVTAPKLRRVITYMTQPDYLSPEPLKSNTTYQVYLDVWERLVTCLEDESIREVALGGPDTTARTKVVWQVKVTPGTVCPEPADLKNQFQKDNRGRLKAMARQNTASTDPCIVSPEARYRGAENQLYRVEIHRAGNSWNGTGGPQDTNAATFKWSRENGSVVFPVISVATDSGAHTTSVVLETLGRDDRFGLAEGDWVELQDDDYALQNRAERLLQVQSIDRTAMTVTLSGAPGIEVGNDPALHPLLRRWDHKEGDPAEGGLQLGSDGAALILEDSGKNDNWLNLEDGVQIQFQKPKSGQASEYRTGDYWLIPARTATGDVEWPKEKDSHGNLVPIAKPPDGVTHHYAPLWIVSVDANGAVTADSKNDCRRKIKQLWE